MEQTERILIHRLQTQVWKFCQTIQSSFPKIWIPPQNQSMTKLRDIQEYWLRRYSRIGFLLRKILRSTSIPTSTFQITLCVVFVLLTRSEPLIISHSDSSLRNGVIKLRN